MNDPIDNTGRDYHGNPHPTTATKISDDLLTARKQIAKDALDALNSKRLIASREIYIYEDFDDADEDTVDEYIDQFRETNKETTYKTPAQCEVCAIGAVFIATVDRHNSLDLAVIRSDPDAYDGDNGGINIREAMRYLSKWFTVEELKLMETAFEGEYISGVVPDGFDEQRPAFLNAVDQARSLNLDIADIYDEVKEIHSRFSEAEFAVRLIMEDIAEHGAFNVGRLRQLCREWTKQLVDEELAKDGISVSPRT